MKKAIIIDGDVGRACLTRSILEKKGYSVETIFRLSELSTEKLNSVDIIFTTRAIKGGDAYEWLAKNIAEIKTKIVLISASPLPTPIELCNCCGGVIIPPDKYVITIESYI